MAQQPPPLNTTGNATSSTPPPPLPPLPRLTSLHGELHPFVDLVAIHGILEADADKAWSRGATSLSWLSAPSLLPSSIDRLSVWAYRYSVLPVPTREGGLRAHLGRTANALGTFLAGLTTGSTPITPKSASTSSTPLGAKSSPAASIPAGDRPLILIGHGYGGLVAMKTLILNAVIKDRCIGIVCIGTPFRPVDVDNNIASTLPVMPEEFDNGQSLLDEFEVLPELLSEWRVAPGTETVPIRCFYETEPSRDRNNIVRFVVPKQAAVLDDPNAMSFALDDVDHQNMNKFTGIEDHNYELMIDVLQGLVNNAYPAMLIQAIRHHDLEYARRVINAHRPSFATNEALNSALIEAVEAGDVQILQQMLNANARVNTILQPDSQETLLFYAVRSMSTNKMDIIRRLLEKGADVSVVNRDGKSPIMIAKDHDDEEMVHLLEFRPLILGPVVRRQSYEWIAPPQMRVNDYGSTRKIYAKIADVFDIQGEERIYLRNPSVHDLIYEHGPRHLMNRERARDGEPGERKFRWIHLPANNLAWVKDLIQRSYRERTPDEQYSKDHYIQNYLSVSDNSHWEELIVTSPIEDLSHIRYMFPRCRTLPYIGYPEAKVSANVIIFMPYLHYEYTQKRREMARTIDQIRDGMRSVPPRGNNPDQNALWAYLRRDVPLHIRRTLDQYYYDALDSDRPLKKGVPPRNEDQVTQRFMRAQAKWKNDDPLLLMVDQLWMIVLEDDTLITAFPQRWGLNNAHDPNPYRDADIASMIAKELSNQDRAPFDGPYDMMVRIIELCTSVLFNQALHRNEKLRFFEFFERNIQQVTNQEAETFVYLKTQLEQLSKRNKARDTDATLQRLLDELLDITAEANMLSEIKDIHDELEMLRNLFDTQLKVLADMSELLEYPEAKIPPHVVKKWRKTIISIEQRREKVEIMDINANRTYKSINNLFDLKSRQADVLEVHLTRKVAQDSGRQSTTIMVFTVVTIVFLPLSFMSSFFALSVQEFPRDPGNQNQLFMPLSWVSKRVFGIGIGIAVIIVILGFSLNELKNRLPSREELFGGNNQMSDQQSQRSSIAQSADGSGINSSPPKRIFSGLRRRPTFSKFLPERKTVVAERLDRISMFSYNSYVRPEELDQDENDLSYSTGMYGSKDGATTMNGGDLGTRSSPSPPSTLASFFWKSSPTPNSVRTNIGQKGERATRSWDVGTGRTKWLWGTKTKTWAPDDNKGLV